MLYQIYNHEPKVSNCCRPIMNELENEMLISNNCSIHPPVVVVNLHFVAV